MNWSEIGSQWEEIREKIRRNSTESSDKKISANDGLNQSENIHKSKEKKDKFMSLSFEKAILAFALFTATFLSVAVASASVNKNTQNAADRMGAAAVTEISFAKGTMDLSDSAKSDLKDFIVETKKKGSIKEVRVAAWSDHEYPGKKANVQDSQVNLAQKRAHGVQTYLEDSLNVATVHTINNMAERPNMLQKLADTKTTQTKDMLEKTGAAPARRDQSDFWDMKSKASEAVVMLFYN